MTDHKNQMQENGAVTVDEKKLIEIFRRLSRVGRARVLTAAFNVRRDEDARKHAKPGKLLHMPERTAKQ